MSKVVLVVCAAAAVVGMGWRLASGADRGPHRAAKFTGIVMPDR